MKTTMKSILLSMMVMGTVSGFAQNDARGAGGGNGGGVHFCEGRADQEFYDIYEGGKRYRLKFNTGTGATSQRLLDDAVAKVGSVNPLLAERISKTLAHLEKPENFILDSELDLPVIRDANILLKNKGCKYGQLANWDEVTQRIFVDEVLYETLNDFHQAAFKLHEALYKVARDSKYHSNSDITRRAVAEIMSQSKEMPTLQEFLLDTDYPAEGFRVVNSYDHTFTLVKNPSCTEDIAMEITNKGPEEFSGSLFIYKLDKSKTMTSDVIRLKPNQTHRLSGPSISHSSVTFSNLYLHEIQVRFIGCGMVKEVKPSLSSSVTVFNDFTE